jgi:hypothetical protein
MYRCLFIKKNGDIIDDGSLAERGGMMIARADGRFIGASPVMNGRVLFIEVNEAEYVAWRKAVEDKGGHIVTVNSVKVGETDAAWNSEQEASR